MTVGGFVGTASAEPIAFRIETVVHAQDDPTPITTNVTFFHQGQIIDLGGPGESEMVVYEPARGQFCLMQAERQVKSEVDYQYLLEFAAALGQRAQQAAPWLQALANPRFAEAYDAQSGQLRLSQPQLEYRVLTEPAASDGFSVVYRQFGDGFARLNALKPGGLPPTARLALNEALARHGRFATRIERQLAGIGPVWVSEHAFDWQWTPEDHRRIARVTQAKETFRLIPLHEFYPRPENLATPAASPPAKR